MSKRVNRIMAMAIATNILLSSFGVVLPSNAIDSKEKPGVYDENVKYKDGVYIGEGDSYHTTNGKLKMKVEIKDGKITSIEFLEDSADYTYPDDREPFKEIATKIIDGFLLKDPQNVYKVNEDLEKFMSAGDRKLTNTEYNVVTGASYTARGISRAVANALDISRKAAENTKTIVGISLSKKPTTNIYQQSGNVFNKSITYKAMIGDEINLNEIEVEKKYNDGSTEKIPFNKLKENGFDVTFTDPETGEEKDVSSESKILIKEPYRAYEVFIKHGDVTEKFKVVSFTRDFVEDDLKYRVGEDGEYKDFKLALEDEEMRSTYSVDQEAISRPLNKQFQEVITVKSSDIGEKIYFKTTGYKNTVTGTTDVLKPEKMEYNYTPIEITKDMSDVNLLRRVSAKEDIKNVRFNPDFDHFKLKFKVEDDKAEQVELAKKLISEIGAIKEEGLSNEKLEGLKKLKTEVDKLNTVVNKADSTSKEVKEARVALDKAYAAYKNLDGKKSNQSSSGRPSSSSSDKKADEKVETPLRISGEDRISTSVEISKKTYQNADTVILTNGYKNSDSLTAGGLASKLKAPILLTEKDRVSDKVLSEISRLKAKKVIIIGGSESISENVKSNLSGLEVERIAGIDRYETSSKVAQKLYDLDKNKRAVIVNGLSLVDALSTSSLADVDRGAVLLTEGDKLNKHADEFIKKNKIERVLVLGGENSVSSKVESYLKTLNVKTKRMAGADRYDTSRKIALSVNNREEIVFASGENFVDSLSASPYVEKNKSALILTSNKANLESEKDVIKKSGAKRLSFIGGKNSLSDNLVKELSDLILKK